MYISDEKDSIRSGKPSRSYPDNYVVLDLETTGLSPADNTIIEAAAVLVRGGVIVDRFQTLINPGSPLDPFITGLTGITDEMLADAPSVERILPAFLDFVGTDPVVGHNVAFDIGFLRAALDRHFGLPFLNPSHDTMWMSRRYFKGESRHRLSDVIARCGVGETVEHRALADVLQTQQCYEYLRRLLDPR